MVEDMKCSDICFLKSKHKKKAELEEQARDMECGCDE
jgi:hypothetical protein